LNSFSAKDRADLIGQLTNSSFDVVIIGGGITGAGIVLDAVSRGLKVALIDMQDFAGGTSGRSTKLIHGGLRYLKQMEFKLVAEVGKEREIIHRLAPHLTKPEPMLLPIIKNGSLGMFSSRIGMSLYEWLAGVKEDEKHHVLDRDEALKTEPLLQKENLLGGILFYEYRTDDSRLTMEVLKEASNRGALAVNYIKATEFLYTNGKISGVKVKDEINGQIFSVRSKYLVNAAGPWVDELDTLDHQHMKYLILTKGVHLVVSHKKLPVKQVMYFEAKDRRMIFLIPREGKTYIGTTDTFYSGDLKDPRVTEEDMHYLLRCVNDYFPGITIQSNDIESQWAGLRPLINRKNDKPSEISRKDEMFVSGSGLITIAGGKLTGYRKMAERVVNKIAESMDKSEHKKLHACVTHQIVLSGGKIKSAFTEFLKMKVKEGVKLGLTIEETEKLACRYGSNIDQVFHFLEELKNEESPLPLSLRAELRYAVHYEMCHTPADFFIRRTGMLYFDYSAVEKWKDHVCDYMKQMFSWDTEREKKLKDDLQKQLSFF
jgi:glycerol-3-phosphate dehydrogenase